MTGTTPGPPTSFPPPPPSYGAAHHQEHEPTGQYFPPPEAQGGFFLRSSLPLPLSPLPSLSRAFVPQVPVWQAPKSAPALSTPSARAMGDDDASGSANGPFSAASKPPQALRNAHSGRIVDLAPNCCGYRILQKALDCKKEVVCLLTGSELLRVDPATMLVNKHASHVSNKLLLATSLVDTELSWTPPAPPSFTYVNKSLKGKYAVLACHETGLLIVQRAKNGIVDELLGHGAAALSGAPTAFSTVCPSVSAKIPILIIFIFIDSPRTQVGEAPPSDFEHSLTAAREGGKEMLDCVLQRMCEPANGVRRAMIVDLAFSLTGSQLIASILAMADKDQCASLYDCIRGHVARLQDRLDGYLAFVRPSNPISPLPALMCALLHDRMCAYYRY
ncbi:hypothetical protein B0H14DRAFT_3515971 [Mycena olivaceomarginata]|nr:hypothetical protein B0H14DRAFT_3515971 [Mycena olivaceomarginata]